MIFIRLILLKFTVEFFCLPIFLYRMQRVTIPWCEFLFLPWLHSQLQTFLISFILKTPRYQSFMWSFIDETNISCTGQRECNTAESRGGCALRWTPTRSVTIRRTLTLASFRKRRLEMRIHSAPSLTRLSCVDGVEIKDSRPWHMEKDRLKYR